jgi:sugar phosphate isomerase/epimerase
MRLGISSFTYVWAVGVPGYEQPDRPMTAWELLDKAEELGIHVVQFADNLPLDLLSSDERSRLLRRATSSGISLETGMAGIEHKQLLRGLALAKELGSPILRLLIDTKGCEPTIDEVVSALGGVAKEFEREHVVLAIENHDRFNSGTLRQIVERIDSRCVGICYDTANSIGCLESAEQVLQTLAPFIVNVHLKDYCVFRPKHSKGFVVEGRAAGQGQLDIVRIFPRITELAHDCNVILELWPPPQATLTDSIALESRWAEESIRYLRQFLPE